MSIASIVLYSIVIIITIIGSISRYKRSKKATFITLAVSPVYLFVTYFIFPYMSLRGNFGGIPGAIYDFIRGMGFSQYESVFVRNLLYFILFWFVFFKLSTLTYEFVYKKINQEEESYENPFD